MASVRILNYDCCRLMWKSCRFPNRGKPIAVQGCRLFREGDNFVLFRYGDRLASITPDSMFTLHVMPEGNLQWALGRIFNLRVGRYGKGKYRVGLQRTKTDDEGHLPRYFSGIRFDMFSHMCVNESARPPDPVRVKDVARELEWQRALRTYVKGWKVRAKIGALTATINKYMPELVTAHRYNKIDSQALIAIVKSEDYDKAAALLVWGALSWWESKRVAELGWEGFLNQAFNQWVANRPSKYDLTVLFDRVYRRCREDIYDSLGIVTIQDPLLLNPAV